MKIINCITNSFFRTIGRVLAYLAIGGIIVAILSKAKLPSVDSIANDIFFANVYADSFDTSYWRDYYSDSAKTDLLPRNDNRSYQYFTPVKSNNLIKSTTIYFSSDLVKLSSFDYIYIPYIVSGRNYSTDNELIDYQVVCDYSATNLTMEDNHSYWYTDYTLEHWADSGEAQFDGKFSPINCRYWATGSSTPTPINFQFVAHLFQSNGANQSICINEDNRFKCYLQDGISYDRMTIYYTDSVQNYNVSLLFNLGNVIPAYIDSSQRTTTAINNTTNAINNQSQVIEQTTNATIENQNQNTQQQIESQQVCTQIDKNNVVEDGYLTLNGTISSNSAWGVTDYINIQSSTIKTIITRNETNYGICFYNVNKTLINCVGVGTLIVGDYINIPQNAIYMRSSINIQYNRPTYELCQNGNQALSNTITDSTAPDISSSLSNDTVAGWLPPGPIDSLVNLPLTLFNSITTAMGGTCTPLTVPLPFISENISIPCMSGIYTDMGFGSFFNWIGVIASAFILFSYLMKLYKWVDDTLTFRENNHLDNWGGV